MAKERFSLSPDGASLSSLRWICRFTPNEKLSKVLGESMSTAFPSPQLSEWTLVGSPIAKLVEKMGLSTRYRHARAEAVGVILMGLLATLATARDIVGVKGLCLSRAASSFLTPQRYRTNRIGQQVWTQSIDFLERMGFAQKLFGGFKGSGYFSGLTSTYVPTPRLEYWFVEHSSMLSLVRLSKSEPLLLTTSNRLIDYCDDDHTNALRRQIEDINRVNQSYQFTLQRGDCVEALDSHLLVGKRRFRDDFHSGGRLFLPLQGLRKSERQHLAIDGEKTTELDFSSHAPRMLFHMNGQEAPEDCYAHHSIPRELMKETMLRVTNCDTQRTALRSLSKLLREKGIKNTSSRELLEAVEQTNPHAVNGMKHGRWKEIQFTESKITCNIAHQLHKKGIPCLPIHDSFVVRNKDRDILRQVMYDEYQREFPRFVPVVKEAV